MVVCFICKSEFSNNKGGQLTNHLKNDHNITLLEYVILTEYDNIPPKCKCGLCDEIPHLYRGKFLKYAKGHDSFKFRQEKYIKLFGYPKCETCKKEVGFYRERPNRYCSAKCCPDANWNQEKVKNTVKEKYGVNNIMMVKEIREKSALSIKNLWLNNKEEMISKIINSNLENYGIDYPNKLEFFKEKQRETIMKNHGVTHYSKTDKFKKESSNRMTLNNPMKDPEVAKKVSLKMVGNNNFTCSQLKYKNTDINYQGSYEYDFLQFCENNNVLHLISRASSFKYLNSKANHFPDFLFNNEYIIEIKSKWILDLQGGMEIIQEKIKSVEPTYKYLLILDKDYHQFSKILEKIIQ